MDAGDYLLYFVYVFSTIFVIVNPIEATMVYVTLTIGLPPLEKSRIYKRATLVAFNIAILFAMAGRSRSRLCGNTRTAIRVGRSSLFWGHDMLRGVHQQRRLWKKGN